MLRKIAFLTLAMLLAACGTVATPIYDIPTITPTLEPTETLAATEVAAANATAELPSATPIPATSTPVPPTETPIPATEAPTTEPTQAAPGAPTEVIGADDPLKFFVDLANPENGRALFNTDFTTASGVWQCATCHNVEGTEVKIGPSLFGVMQRAGAHATHGAHVDGEGPYTYAYNSIRYSQAYLVPEFAAEGMVRMPDFDGILTDAQIYDLIAYLNTLR